MLAIASYDNEQAPLKFLKRSLLFIVQIYLPSYDSVDRGLNWIRGNDNNNLIFSFAELIFASMLANEVV